MTSFRKPVASRVNAMPLAGLCGTLATLATLVAMPSWGQDKAPAGPANPVKDSKAVPTVPSCGPECWAPRSGVETATLELAAALGRIRSSKTLIVPALDAGGGKIAALVARHLAGKLSVPVHPTAIARADIKALASRGMAIVFVEPKVAGGRLQVAADLYQRKSTIWARVRNQKFGPIRHASSVVPLDAEIRSFLAPLAFGPVKVSRYEGGDRGVVAVACGDLDRDGVLEIATVSRRRVLLLGLDDRKQRVVRLHEASWSKLSPLASSPMREPIGFARIVEGRGRSVGYLDVGLTDRHQSARLDPRLRLVAHLDHEVTASGANTACAKRDGLRLGPQAQKCQPYDAEPTLLARRYATDVSAGASLVSQDGKVRQFLAGRRKNAIVLTTKDGDSVLWAGGAQLAVGDLDQDGQPDVVASRNVFNSSKDAVVVKTMLDTGTVKQRFEIAVPGGVDAVGICPAIDGGIAPVVVATKGEVWVLR